MVPVAAKYFRLISIVLERTGAYKICLMPAPFWEVNDWASNVRIDAKIWKSVSNERIENEKLRFNTSALLKRLCNDKYHFKLLKMTTCQLPKIVEQ